MYHISKGTTALHNSIHCVIQANNIKNSLKGVIDRGIMGQSIGVYDILYICPVILTIENRESLVT